MKMRRIINNYSYANSHNVLMSRGFGAWKYKKVYLLVEGKTDKAFIDRLGLNKLQCHYIGDPKKASDYLKNIDKNLFVDRDAKASIKNIVKNQFQKKSEEVYYGLIDKDFDNKGSHKNLLVTPQHDLETLLLFTDGAIFDIPKSLEESFKITKRLAFRLGLIRRYLWNNYCILILENKKGKSDLSKIINTDERKIDLSRLVNFVKKKGPCKELETHEKETLKNNIKEYVVSVDKDGMISVNSKIFAEGIKEVPDDVYDITNGHDIANIMKLLCKEDIDEFIESHNAEKHDRDVEYAIIDKYTLSNFRNSPLYTDMTERGLTPTARDLL